jgi:hypothetical protein
MLSKWSENASFDMVLPIYLPGQPAHSVLCTQMHCTAVASLNMSRSGQEAMETGWAACTGGWWCRQEAAGPARHTLAGGLVSAATSAAIPFDGRPLVGFAEIE